MSSNGNVFRRFPVKPGVCPQSQILCVSRATTQRRHDVESHGPRSRSPCAQRRTLSRTCRPRAAAAAAAPTRTPSLDSCASRPDATSSRRPSPSGSTSPAQSPAAVKKHRFVRIAMGSKVIPEQNTQVSISESQWDWDHKLLWCEANQRCYFRMKSAKYQTFTSITPLDCVMNPPSSSSKVLHSGLI